MIAYFAVLAQVADDGGASSSTIAAIVAAASPIVLGIFALFSPSVQKFITKEKKDDAPPIDADHPLPPVPIPPGTSPVNTAVRQLSDNASLMNSMVQYQQRQIDAGLNREQLQDERIERLVQENTDLRVRVAELEAEVRSWRMGRGGSV